MIDRKGKVMTSTAVEYGVEVSADIEWLNS